MNTRTKALKGRLGKVKDYFTGTSRVNNRANPASAYSMMMRKTASKAPGKTTGLRPQ
jgi:hypothetical protein